ncbi:MAG: protein translocase subunit SecF [Acidobacteria bacterium]|nr:protein translocase subunit SecF [Acidobacteriota bacterium]
MRFLHDTHFQFMKYRKFWITVSTVLNLLAIGLILFGPGFKYGVDFAGGTQVTLKFKSEPDQARVRKALEDLKLGAVNIQRFDEAERHELLVRVQNPGEEGDFSAQMLGALDKEFNPAGGRIRMNLQGMEALRDALVEADPDRRGGTVSERRAHYEPMAQSVLNLRKQSGIFSGPQDLDKATELSATTRSFLSENARFGEFSVLAADSVGPAVGKDLRKKAGLAIVFSILGMLVYIWFRFQLQYGIGAIVALLHDTLITLGVLSLTGREIDIPAIAALLTLVGYSVNDTVVIFDRIRERLKLDRGKSLVAIMDVAINQTLSRTIITGGLTWLVVMALFLFGGDVINTFAFVLVIGLIVGSYSTIYIASPIALAVSNWREKRLQAKRRR